MYIIEIWVAGLDCRGEVMGEFSEAGAELLIMAVDEERWGSDKSCKISKLRVVRLLLVQTGKILEYNSVMNIRL